MVVRSEISRQMEDKLKRLYPESKSLDFDREYTAKNVLDPRSPKDIKKWAENTQKYDIKGFDTKKAKEPSKKQVMKKLNTMLNSSSGEEALELEPERFVKKSEAGELINNNKDNIKDFDSFVETIEKSWKDDSSLVNLLSNIKNKEVLRNMFNTSTIQNYVLNNTKVDMMGYIIKRFGVEQVRASNVVNTLSKEKRASLYRKIKLKQTPKLKYRGKRLPNKRKWSTQEINLIKANKHLTPKSMANVFKDLTAYNRNRYSLMQKMKELGLNYKDKE